VQWIKGSTVISAKMNKFLLRAEADLKAAGNEFDTQIAELRWLSSAGNTNLTPAQRAKARRKTRALNAFFGTPGLYL
jgi:hypothetical protein